MWGALFKPVLWGYKQVGKSERSKEMTRKFYKEKQEAEDAKKYREMMKKNNVKKAKKGGVINRARGGGVY